MKNNVPDPLMYGELIAPKGVPQILGPNQIPIAPQVYFSDFAYTQAFVNEVAGEAQSSVARDIAMIEQILKKKFNVTVTYDGIEDGINNLDLAFVDHVADEEKKKIDVVHSSSNIALDGRLEKPNRELQLTSSYPMSAERLKQFSVTKEGLTIPVWYVHNHLDNGLPLELYFRNFAIMFNNLGIKKLRGH